MGAEVKVVEAYRSIVDGAGAERLVRAIEAGNVDLVTFTSASAKTLIQAVNSPMDENSPTCGN